MAKNEVFRGALKCQAHPADHRYLSHQTSRHRHHQIIETNLYCLLADHY